MGEYLSSVEKEPPSERSVDMTDTFINRLYDAMGKPNIKEYNRVRIKESQKINNDRFLESLRLMQLKKRARDA